jgi:Actin like proteins N terminal domain
VAAIVRAIDVGYRNTKYVCSVVDGGIQCRVFPSVAPTATCRDLSEALGRKRHTVIVEADGLRYEVGPDALLAEKPNAIQSVDNDYWASPEYLALVRGGAIAKSGVHGLIRRRSCVTFDGLPFVHLAVLRSRRGTSRRRSAWRATGIPAAVSSCAQRPCRA